MRLLMWKTCHPNKIVYHFWKYNGQPNFSHAETWRGRSMPFSARTKQLPGIS